MIPQHRSPLRPGNGKVPFVVLAAEEDPLRAGRIEPAFPKQARRLAQNRVSLRLARYAKEHLVDRSATQSARFRPDYPGFTANFLAASRRAFAKRR